MAKDKFILPDGVAGNPVLGALYPAYAAADPLERRSVRLPAPSSAYWGPGQTPGPANSNRAEDVLTRTTQEGTCEIFHRLPTDRAARYAILHLMAEDPTIDAAIKMHVSNALSAKQDTGEYVYIELRRTLDAEDREEGTGPVDAVLTDNPAIGPTAFSRKGNPKPQEVVDGLNGLLSESLRADLLEWARKTIVYGICPVRVYGAPGVGITSLRCDFYTHPRFVTRYEKGGRVAGYTSAWQSAAPGGLKGIELLPPWYYVCFEIPEKDDDDLVEPVRVGGLPIDLSCPDTNSEAIYESQAYGNSLIAKAYGPWMDLLSAICSLSMSRRNAARLERIIGISTGKLDPERAARYINMISEQISSSSAEAERGSWLKGNVQTVANHFVPVFGEKGRIQIDAVQGTPDINALEDVNFYVKRLGGALGVDPSLLGFGDMLSGGLGDGGFFRVSVLAAVKANLIRAAIREGLNQICQIHCAYRYGKVYVPGTEPWSIRFNSVSSAIEREEAETQEKLAGIAGGIVQVLAAVDQDFSIADKREVMHVACRMMRVSEEDFNAMVPAPEEQGDGAEQEEQDGGGTTGGKNPPGKPASKNEEEDEEDTEEPEDGEPEEESETEEPDDGEDDEGEEENE